MPLKHLIAVLAVATAATSAEAGKFNATLSAGDAAPEFKDLPGVDGESHSLADYADAKAVVVVITCNHCPIARGYETRLLDLAKAYRERGVQFIAVSCSLLEADRLPAMKERAKSSGYPFPYLHDESQQTARDYGASVTPEVFLLDGERKIAYLGAIDDQWTSADNVKRHYLRDALEAVLAGQAPETFESKPVGCPIQFQ